MQRDRRKAGRGGRTKSKKGINCCVFHFDASEAGHFTKPGFGKVSIFRETKMFVSKEKYLFKLSGCFEMKLGICRALVRCREKKQ